MRNFILLLFFFSSACSKINILPPSPVYPIPSVHQLEWQEKELCAFVHFTVNTFTDKEWGYGDENPNIFNPTEYNPYQWAEVLKQAGFKGVILTAKHHDGFCLWPSKYTNHSVKNISWKEGNGNVVRDLRDACIMNNLEFGVYLSPWDRNHKDYGTPAYINFYRKQLYELLSQYGPFFEVWFDGANGGDGFYGGTYETRKINDQDYYDWSSTFSVVRGFNPKTIIFGDARAESDVRWCGNEKGFVGETNWNMISPDSLKAIGKEFKQRAQLLNFGEENGTAWIPAEVDVSIRPGWFYHEKENKQVKTADELFDIFLSSVGRGANLLLNVTPDKRGLIPEPDVRSLLLWKKKIDETFSKNLVSVAKVEVDSYRGKSNQFAAINLADGNKETYWATDDKITSGSIELDFNGPQLIQYVLVQEYIRLGQRVKSFSIEVFVNGQWEEVANATTIGYKRIIRFEPVQTERLRVNITDSKACLAISNIEVY